MANTVPQIDNALDVALANIAALQGDVVSMFQRGRKFYVNPSPTVGSDSSAGSKDYPFLTLAKALAVADQFDAIGFTGTVSEDSLQLVTPNIAIVGLGFGNAGAVLQNAADDKTLIDILAANCLLANFKVRPPVYNAGVPKGFALSAAHYLSLIGLHFQGRAGSWYGIYSDVTSDNVKIKGCKFLYMNTATYGTAIKGVAVAGTVHSGWIIEDNYFTGNVNHLVAPSAGCFIRKNRFASYGLGPAGSAIQTTKKIDLSGTNAGYNNINENSLGGAYSHAGGYQEATNDDWSGNLVNVSGTGTITGALPA